MSKGPMIKSKGKKLPKAESAEMGCVKEAPSSKKKSMPHATAPAGVSSGDGDGMKVSVNAEVAKAAPSSKGAKKQQGEAMSLPKGDSDGRHS